MGQLPQPIDGTQEYLAAIHDRLGELLDRLPKPAADRRAEGGQVELREPARPDLARVEVSEPLVSSTQEGPGVAKRPARPARKTTTRTKKET